MAKVDQADNAALIVVLGDQLSPSLPSLRNGDPKRDTVLMCEVHDEATYVRHHKKKIAFIFSAMRHFAEELRADGWTVRYVELDDKHNTGSFSGEVGRALEATGAAKISVTEAGEYRVQQMLEGWEEKFGTPVTIHDDTRFLCSHAEFEVWAKGRKQLRMEYFYREMRRKTGLLMEGNEPVGGKWNFDHDNRKPAEADLFMPKILRFDPDAITQDVLDLVRARFDNHIGSLEPFWFAVTREDAEAVRQNFMDEKLASFGDYQDAMLRDEKFLYHSLLSFYINAGLLDPIETCRMAEQAFESGKAPINAVEGFIRQIIGWREYVRGIYWREMPGYGERNFFHHDRALPDFYWTGQTNMTCLREAIGQTLDEAYAHHIQRLMVTGTFAMLAGVDPKEVHEWYLAVYADAYEWVEMPNVIGMSQFADGGLLASKPYAASGNYISKMSDYCSDCAYKVSKKTESDACPFNSLYWDFIARNEEFVSSNPRMAQMGATWRRMKPETKSAYRTRARWVLDNLDAL